MTAAFLNAEKSQSPVVMTAIILFKQKSSLILVRMICELSPLEIENLLREQTVGHIGCCDGSFPYVVPISYVYDGEYIFCYSQPGSKIDIMRKNPNVCFQVDEMRDRANWKSVVVRGTYDELSDREQINKAVAALVTRHLPVPSGLRTHLGQTWPFVADGTNALDNMTGVVFRIKLEEKSGKSECLSESPSFS
jgi:nitroimidazol reductase NimA-like FMN-containing flavoprotein (pyridoxamine 5'-phosphate oxidase superfamily)